MGRKRKTKRDQAPPVKLGAPDPVLLCVVLLLMACGLVMVYSASVHTAASDQAGNTYFLVRNGLHVLIGIAAMLLMSRVPYRIFQRLVPWLVLVTVTTMVLVLVIGHTAGNAQRWLDLGFAKFQPGELAKVVLVVYLAHVASAKAEDMSSLWRGYVPPLIVAGVLMVTALAQPDFGTAVILGLIVVTMLFVAGTRLAYVVGTVLISVPCLVWVLWGTRRWLRLEAFFDPLAHRFGLGWQTVNSLAAIASGGLSGVGLGQGHQKAGYIPEAQTDFVVSVIGEELGLVGTLFLLSLFALIAARGIRAARRAPDIFGNALGFGLVFLLCVQVLINVGVAYGALPTKGLTLPLVSYGGTSMLMTSICIGVLLHLSRLPAGAPGTQDQASRAGVSRDPMGNAGAIPMKLATSARRTGGTA